MFNDLVRQAYGAMKHDRRRTMLTMAGMAWGIATVVLLLAYGSGFGRAINTIFSSFGAQVIGIFPGRTSQQAGGSNAGTQIRLQMEDVDRLAANIPLITHISPDADKQAVVGNGTRSFTFPVSGNNASIQRIRNLSPDTGRFFNNEDYDSRARVVVIGSEAKTKLFSGLYAVGQNIRIDGVTFNVIGVLNPKMQEGNDDINRVVYVPFSTMGDLKDTRYLDGIWVDYETTEYGKVEKMVRDNLAAAHSFQPSDPRAVYIFNSMKQVKQFEIVTMGLKVLLAFIGALTLGIGGVGLMNIMLVAVSQRTREIGVEKALGAQKKHILTQFLAEAMVITFAGGVFGIVLAYAVSFGVGRITFYSALAKNAEAADIRLIISPISLIVSTGILIVVGVVSGMLPAMRAANLDPIEALRYE